MMFPTASTAWRDVLTAMAGGRTVFTFELVTKQDTNGNAGTGDDGPVAGTIIFTLEDQVDHAFQVVPTGDPLGQNFLTVDFDDLLDIRDADDDPISLPGEAEYDIEDDVPTIGPISDIVVDYITGDMDSTTLNALVGADEDATFRITDYTGIGGEDVIVNGDTTLTAELTQDETLVSYFDDANGNDTLDPGETLYYTYELVDTGDADSIIDSAKFTVVDAVAADGVEFDLNELPSGQNLFGILAGKVAGETEVLPDGPALIVIGRDVSLNDPGDGTYDNTSDTINTSQGGGPTTIGNSNQMIDALEGIYFAYVSDPEDSFLSGFSDPLVEGLDQNEADDADNIIYTLLTSEPENPLVIYPAHVRTRKSFGDMTRKLSDTSSHKSPQFLGTSSFRNPSMASQNSLKVA